jgi:uncharacterized protein YjiS (DUF1127 family)
MQCNTSLVSAAEIEGFHTAHQRLTALHQEFSMITVDTLRKRLRNWSRYRNTVRELSQLTDRDLADLGIARGDIRFVAKKHARG